MLSPKRVWLFFDIFDAAALLVSTVIRFGCSLVHDRLGNRSQPYRRFATLPSPDSVAGTCGRHLGRHDRTLDRVLARAVDSGGASGRARTATVTLLWLRAGPIRRVLRGCGLEAAGEPHIRAMESRDLGRLRSKPRFRTTPCSRKSPGRSPANTRPVQLAPWATGVRPTIQFGPPSPTDGTGRPQQTSSR